MLSILSTLVVVLLGLLVQVQGVKGWRPESHSPKHVHLLCAEDSTVYDGCVTVFDTTETAEITHYVDVTVNRTVINTIEECVTESRTTTLLYTVSVTQTAVATVTVTDTGLVTVTDTATDSTTVINTEIDKVTVTNTDTDSVTITETDSVTITNTATTTTTVPTTTYTTRTVFSTTFDPCPKSCSISVATVNVFFWPTDRPYTYPSTYVDPKLGYTFTSPSVYLLIPTAVGINTAGQTVGPSTTSWMLPLSLREVSTIDGSITRQLSLSDLGTDCPQTADPTAIATMVDSRCDPILAAPSPVRSWAYPCNACGRFGVFDPPYAIPTLTGGLVEPSPWTAPPPPPPPPVTTTVTVAPPTGTTWIATDPNSRSAASESVSGAGPAVSTAQDPTRTVSVGGSESTPAGASSSSTGTAAAGGGSTATGASTGVATAAGATVRAGKGVRTWLVPVSGIVVAMFCL